ELAEVDIAEHLERPGLLPPFHADVGNTAAGNGTGVVDEDVDVGERFVQTSALSRLRQVRGVRGGAGVVPAGHLSSRGLQYGLVARHNDDVCAFGRKSMRQRPADA